MIVGLLGEILQVIFGLMILSTVAPMSLSEERQQSSLDVLVVTPLSARSIVLGKWLGVFRLVPLVTIGPGLMMLALATTYDQDLSLGFRLFRFGLLIVTILVHGALITSVGLAVATWIERQSRAIAMSVFVFVFVSVMWPITAIVAGPWRYAQGLAALSPITAAALVVDKGMIRGDLWSFHLWVTFWDVMVAYGAFRTFVSDDSVVRWLFRPHTRPHSTNIPWRGRHQALSRRDRHRLRRRGDRDMDQLSRISITQLRGLAGARRCDFHDHDCLVDAARRGDVCRTS